MYFKSLALDAKNCFLGLHYFQFSTSDFTQLPTSELRKAKRARVHFHPNPKRVIRGVIFWPRKRRKDENKAILPTL